jgi:cytochrome d ubiquinol oxidase subunit I
MFCLLAYGLYLVVKKKLDPGNFVIKIFPFAIALPYVANTTGWLLTELGRQPWVVYELKKTADAVSPNVPTSTILVSLIGFTIVYGALMVVDVYLLAKYARIQEVE